MAGLCCCKEPEAPAGTEVVITAMAVPGTGISAERARLADIVLKELNLTIGDIQFFAEEQEVSAAVAEPGQAVHSFDHLKGPFPLSMLDGQGFGERVVASVVVPPSSYAGLAFSLNGGSGPSLEVLGTIGGAPFKLLLHSNRQVKIAEQISIPSGGAGQVHVKLYFNFGYLLSSEAGIELSEAEDRDGNGLIEIGAADGDGNDWIVHELEAKIESGVHLIAG